jgi:preprotein translocase subunit SecB
MNKKDGPMRIFRHSYKSTQVGTNFFEASGAFVVSVQESEVSRPVLHVECEFEAHLHGPEPISKASVERFVDSEFALILVPYARQFVSATTAQMSVPPLVIPLSVGDDPPKNRGIVVRSKKAAKSHAKAR